MIDDASQQVRLASPAARRPSRLPRPGRWAGARLGSRTAGPKVAASSRVSCERCGGRREDHPDRGDGGGLEALSSEAARACWAASSTHRGVSDTAGKWPPPGSVAVRRPNRSGCSSRSYDERISNGGRVIRSESVVNRVYAASVPGPPRGRGPTRLGQVLAHQHLGQLPPDIRAAVALL